jgi:HEAT repeat protein
MEAVDFPGAAASWSEERRASGPFDSKRRAAAHSKMPARLQGRWDAAHEFSRAPTRRALCCARQKTISTMLQSLKLWRLRSALNSKGNAQEAFSAVIELGQLGGEGATKLLIEALARGDGVARSAARELGRIGDERALRPLAELLASRENNQAASEALIRFGPKAVDTLIAALKYSDARARQLAATALGEIRDARAVEPLALVAQADDDYAVRTAAVTSLGQLKDPKAVWAIVGVLKLRDETTPEQQAALTQLRDAANLAMRKLGDPLKAQEQSVAKSLQDAVHQVEAAITESEVHPRLIGDVGLVSSEELVGVLKDLVNSSEEISWANLERREPLLPAWFKTYERRAQAAKTVGQELHRRGGTALMREVFDQQLGSYAAISNWWSGIGSWE